LKGLCTAENLYTINQRAMENPSYDSPATKIEKIPKNTKKKNLKKRGLSKVRIFGSLCGMSTKRLTVLALYLNVGIKNTIQHGYCRSLTILIYFFS